MENAICGGVVGAQEASNEMISLSKRGSAHKLLRNGGSDLPRTVVPHSFTARESLDVVEASLVQLHMFTG